MAVTHKITDGTTEVDLTGGTFELLRDGYIPAVASPPGDGSIPAYVTELLPVKVSVSNANGLAGALQDLATLQRHAAEFWADPTTKHTQAVWYYQKLDDETGERRALVRDVSVTLRQSYFSTPAPKTVILDLSVTRHPYYEKPTHTSLDSVTFGTGIVGSYNPGSIPGDVPARLAPFYLTFDTTDAADIDRVWCGVRSNDKHRNAAQFEATWECESGINGTDASWQNDSTASGGSYVHVNPDGGTETWAERVSIGFDDIVSFSVRLDNYGASLFLLRAKTDASSTTWEVKIKHGFSGMANADFAEQPSFTVESTSWDLYEAGYLTVPPPGEQFRISGATADDWEVQIWARRTTGSGDLDLDCLVLIPVDEGFLYVDGMDVNLGTTTSMRFSDRATDETVAIVETGGSIKAMCPFVAHNFRAPVGGGRIIVAWARGSSSVLSDQIGVHANTRCFPRWLALRGSE